jgi:hypothetical protein
VKVDGSWRGTVTDRDADGDEGVIVFRLGTKEGGGIFTRVILPVLVALLFYALLMDATVEVLLEIERRVSVFEA